MFLKIQAIIISLSLVSYIFLLFYHSKLIGRLFRKIPLWLIGFNFGLLFYKIFLIPHFFSSRGDFGIWILGTMARQGNLINNLQDWKSPTYSFILKLFSKLFGGIDFNFVVNFNIILSFISIFCIFLLTWFLFKDKLIASIASLFYAISPIIFIFSLNEDYSNPAIFFSIQALLFAVIYVYKKRISFLWLAIAASILAIGCRPGYIIFAIIFILFLWLLAKKFLGHRLWLYTISYILLVFPRFVAVYLFFNNTVNDTSIHGSQPISPEHTFIDTFSVHSNLFIDNLSRNLLMLLDFKTLMGIFFLLIILIFISPAFKKYKKPILFFAFYCLFFFLLYSFFHDEGVVRYKYLSSLVFPVAVLAAVGLRQLRIVMPKLPFSLLIILIAFYSFYATSFIVDNKFGFSRYGLDSRSFTLYKEYMEYRSLKDDLREEEDNAIFIANGKRTFLYSAIPIEGDKIYIAYSKKQLEKLIKKIEPEKTIYVSQGMCGFGEFQFGYPYVIKDIEFEKIIKKSLNLNKVMFSYYNIDKHHVFLYKMSVKESSD